MQLELSELLRPEDLALCLFSGGGSALLPAPVEGVSLVDKQEVTRLLHASGATIDEMNCVRKHLSRYKGGRLAELLEERGCRAWSLIVSDVIGDPLDVIASGPTAPDPTTFADALHVLDRYQLTALVPATVREHLQSGAGGKHAETPKTIGQRIHNLVLCNNAGALAAAQAKAEQLGYRVLNLGSFIEGETRHVATVFAGLVRSIRRDCIPLSPPVCLLSGGETTVTLSADHGKGGRNQEFVLACLDKLGERESDGVVILSAGTDGEDGPTDAAGAMADRETWNRAASLSLATYLDRHDAYTFFAHTNDLIKTGLTGTNVMDIRVLLVQGTV
jgi:hydroxypyruvate reductase/glycerate 2-kinase